MGKYSFLKGYPVDMDCWTDDNHVYLHLLADDKDYSAAVNYRSSGSSSRLYYCISELSEDEVPWIKLDEGCYDAGKSRNLYLDYEHQSFFSEGQMRPAQADRHENYLFDNLVTLTQRCMAKPSAYVCIFGRMWGPKPDENDWIFDFNPGMGIHDIHKNQGSDPDSSWAAKEMPGQDGAIFYVFPDDEKIIGIFTEFSKEDN